MAASIRYGGIPAPGTGNGKVDFNNMRAPAGKLSLIKRMNCGPIGCKLHTIAKHCKQ